MGAQRGTALVEVTPSTGRFVLKMPELSRAAAGDGDLSCPLACCLPRGQLENVVDAVRHVVGGVRVLRDGAITNNKHGGYFLIDPSAED
jgi:hypothetical protein